MYITQDHWPEERIGIIFLRYDFDSRTLFVEDAAALFVKFCIS